MDVIHEFDPWGSKLCICPKKYTLNPYTGCSHACIYCYISAYVPEAFCPRPKKNLAERLKRDLDRMTEEKKTGSYLSIANSSDPYLKEEKKMGLTREVLKILMENGMKVLLVTKSGLVTRDIDLLRDMRCSVSFSITTTDPSISKKIEPGAPCPKERIDAMRELSKNGIRCSLRLDPIIPGINENEVHKVIDTVSDCCDHVVASTVKFRWDGLKRFRKIFPEVHLDFGERIQNAYYLNRNLRRSILEKVRQECMNYGISFASCREGFPELSTAICDGSYLIP
jgi:DNA repair photolyase